MKLQLFNTSAFVAISSIKFIALLLFYMNIPLSADAQRIAKYRGAEESIEDHELRILSWNIQMLPRMLWKISRGPIRRARLIPQHLIDDHIDIIVFQEAFDQRARRILKRGLRDVYPYKIGPANRAGFRLKTNSGIVIYSKIPIKKLGTIDFKDCENDDCYARKGALLVEAEWQGVTFQVLGTHLEAGGPQWIKRNQYGELKGLINEHCRDSVPQFLCGDFNTSNTDPVLYPEMIATLDVEDGDFFSELKFTADPLQNDMNYKPEKKESDRSVIDYIFYRSNGFIPVSLQRYVRQCQERWCDQFQDLSDHNAVLMRVKFK